MTLGVITLTDYAHPCACFALCKHHFVLLIDTHDVSNNHDLQPPQLPLPNTLSLEMNRPGYHRRPAERDQFRSSCHRLVAVTSSLPAARKGVALVVTSLRPASVAANAFGSDATSSPVCKTTSSVGITLLAIA